MADDALSSKLMGLGGVLGCEPVDGALLVNSSNQTNIATFVHQMGDTYLPSGEQTQQYLIDLN